MEIEFLFWVRRALFSKHEGRGEERSDTQLKRYTAIKRPQFHWAMKTAWEEILFAAQSLLLVPLRDLSEINGEGKATVARARSPQNCSGWGAPRKWIYNWGAGERPHIKKQRHSFANKGPSSQSYGFSSSHVWTWELDYKESWGPKNRCFWIVMLEKTLESPLDCKEIQPANPKEISPEYSLEGMMPELKLQYFGHLMRRTDSLEKTLMLGKIEGGRRRGRQRMRWLDGITDWMGMSLSKLRGVGDGQGSLACCSPWGPKSPTGLSDWIELRATSWRPAPEAIATATGSSCAAFGVGSASGWWEVWRFVLRLYRIRVRSCLSVVWVNFVDSFLCSLWWRTFLGGLRASVGMALVFRPILRVIEKNNAKMDAYEWRVDRRFSAVRTSQVSCVP